MAINPAYVSRPYDIAELVSDPDIAKGFLEDAFSSGDAAEIAQAIGIVARSQGMTTSVEDVEMSDNPTLTTLLRVLKALGFKLSGVVRISPA